MVVGRLPTITYPPETMLSAVVRPTPPGQLPGRLRALICENSLVPANSGFTLATAVGVNDDGQIVVNGYSNTTGQNHAFLLTPS